MVLRLRQHNIGYTADSQMLNVVTTSSHSTEYEVIKLEMVLKYQTVRHVMTQNLGFSHIIASIK